jgi:hypothetical protein
MQTARNQTVSDLMAALRAGQPGAAERLVEIFYPELKRIAANRMRAESPGHTLQPTALVNEFYLELRKIRQLRAIPAGTPKMSASLSSRSSRT